MWRWLQEEVARARAALDALGAGPPAVFPVDSHSGDGQRTALVAHKLRETPAAYPRRAGMPRKRPLGA